MRTGRILLTTDPQQRHRIRRWLMASATSAMAVGLFFAAHIFGGLPLHAFVNAALLTALFVVVFYVAFRSGLNKRFRDASLTKPQILASALVILYVLFESPDNHGVVALIFLVAFLFGVFRLSTRELLTLSVVVSFAYALIIARQMQLDVDASELNRRLLNWIVLTTVLVFFSVMGGYISRLRKKAQDSKVQLEKALLRIEHLATRDELTGLPNRRSLVEFLGGQASRANRHGTNFSVLLLDIDLFKRVNDTHGHLAGDVVLQSLARAASSCVRSNDSLGRYGGEEFMVILDHSPLHSATIVAQRLCQCARELRFEDWAPDLRISVSIGVSEYSRSEDWQVTIARADRALYRAKNAGRDRFEQEPAYALDGSDAMPRQLHA